MYTTPQPKRHLRTLAAAAVGIGLGWSLAWVAGFGGPSPSNLTFVAVFLVCYLVLSRINIGTFDNKVITFLAFTLLGLLALTLWVLFRLVR